MIPLGEYRSILVTGATGSFGKRFIQRLVEDYPQFEKIVVFSRDEYKQYQMAKRLSPLDYPGLSYEIGDVRDRERLEEVFTDVEIVIHAAALKQVDVSERNPLEFIKTNVQGSANVIWAARKSGVRKVIALSSDKAVRPVSAYGASKLCAEKLFIEAAQRKMKRNCVFSVVRYGNVMGSRASVIPYFLQEQIKAKLEITHPKMTRFSVPLGIETELILFAIAQSEGGEIFIPKVPSYNIMDLARAICPSCQLEIKGIRPGEKLHEELIDITEAPHTYDIGKYYVIFPPGSEIKRSKDLNYHTVSENFHYASDSNEEQLDIDALRQQIEAYQAMAKQYE